MKNHLEQLIVFGFILFLIPAYLFVNNALTTGTVQILEKPIKEAVFEEKPIKVTFSFPRSQTQNDVLSFTTSNANNVLEVMEKLQKEDRLMFEKTSYTYGVELSEVNGILPPPAKAWRVLVTSKTGTVSDITFLINKLKVEADAVYAIELKDRVPN